MDSILSASCHYNSGNLELFCACVGDDIISTGCSPTTLTVKSCDTYGNACKDYCKNSKNTGNYVWMCSDNSAFPSSSSNNSTESTIPSSSLVGSSVKEQSSSQPNISLSSMMLLLMLIFSTLYINTN